MTNGAVTRWFAAAKQVAALTMWHICHIKLGAHRRCQLPAHPLFSPTSHILLHRQVSFSHTNATWNELYQRHVQLRREWRRRNVRHPLWESDSVASQETPWLCYCHQCGHRKSPQPSEINTSWPAACTLSLAGRSCFIQADRTGDLSQQRLGVLTWLKH